MSNPDLMRGLEIHITRDGDVYIQALETKSSSVKSQDSRCMTLCLHPFKNDYTRIRNGTACAYTSGIWKNKRIDPELFGEVMKLLWEHADG